MTSYLFLVWAPSVDYYIDLPGYHYTSFGRFGSGGADQAAAEARSSIPIPLQPGSIMRYFRVRVAYNTRASPINAHFRSGPSGLPASNLATLPIGTMAAPSFIGQVTEQDITGGIPLNLPIPPDNLVNDCIENPPDGSPDSSCSRPSGGTIISGALAVIEEPEVPAPTTPPIVILTCAPQGYAVSANGQHFISFAHFDAVIPQVTGPAAIPGCINSGGTAVRGCSPPNCFTGFTENDVQISFPLAGILTDFNMNISANTRSNGTQVRFRSNSGNIFEDTVPAGFTGQRQNSGLSALICANDQINCSVQLPAPGTGAITIPVMLAKIDLIPDPTRPFVYFLNSSNNPMPRTAYVPSMVANVNFPIRIRIVDCAALFNSQSVTFDFTWNRRSGAPTTVTFSNTGAGWVPSAATPTTVTVQNPVDGVGSPVTGNTRQAIFNGSIQVTGEFETIQIQVNATDLNGMGPTPVNASRIISVAIPSDIVLLLDYSGSMLQQDPMGQSKWASAKEAANLFNTLYTAFSSSLPATIDNRIALVRFFTDGFAGPDLTEVTEPLAAPSTAIPLVDDPDPASPNYWTPMGSAVVTGNSATPVSANWRNRIMILMTDGMENRTPMLADIRSALMGNPNFVRSFNEDARTGFRIHACAFGPPGQVDTDAIQALVVGGDGLKSYAGQLHSTETTADANSAFALKERFINLLSDTIPVEVIGPFNTAFSIEPGVNELVCVVTANVAFTVTPPPSHLAPIGAVNAQPGFSWVRISNPAPGTWTLGGFVPSPTVRGYAVVDLSLTAKFEVVRAGIGVGRPIPLVAEISENGIGMTGANVTVWVDAPGESIGQILTEFTNTPSFYAKKDSWQATLSPTLVSRSSSVSQFVEPIAIRRQLLVEALKERNKDLVQVSGGITLNETSPGRYEGTFLNTMEEGTYTFRFRATGNTSSAHPFERDYVVSCHLTPVPDPQLSAFSWASFILADRRDIVLWRGTYLPKTHSSRPLGPGLGHKLAFVAIEKKPTTGGEGKKAALKAIDNLDGTYSIELELPKGQLPPPLGVEFGNIRLPILQTPAQCRMVRITLRRIKVLDDKESWFPSPGEMVFEAAVIPNGDPDRLVTRRIPSSGFIRLTSGESRDLDIVLFSGYLEEGATMELAMGGTEFDSLLFLYKKRDPLARYRRRFKGNLASWAGSYSADDEPDDPESLKDWKVWYDIEIL